MFNRKVFRGAYSDALTLTLFSFAALVSVSAVLAEPVPNVTVQNATDTSVEISWDAPASPVAGYVIELTRTEPDVYVSTGQYADGNEFGLGGDIGRGTLTQLDIDSLGAVERLAGIDSDGVPFSNTLNSMNPGGLTEIGAVADGYGPTPAGDTYGLMGLAFDDNDALYGIVATDGSNCFFDGNCSEEDTASYLVSIDLATGEATELGEVRNAAG